MAASNQWRLWQAVVSGTPAARPWWQYLRRHQEDPERWPVDRAWREYLDQPRCQAMEIFNATVHPGGQLPAGQVEAFQAGHDAYTGWGCLRVPGDAFVDADVKIPAILPRSGPVVPGHQRVADLSGT
jgi:hypothetical protein